MTANMTETTITINQARRFLLLRHGLLGGHKFTGKKGIVDFIEMAGCIQYDPIDVCGKNPELVLQSRVKGFTKQMLYSLLYEDRALIDYFDKNLSIYKTADWPYFGRIREYYAQHSRSRNEVDKVREAVRETIMAKGAVMSQDLGIDGNVSWYWSDTKLARAALETMYFSGELVVHHKDGAIKYYDLAANHIPSDILNAPEPFRDETDHLTWRVKRRIGAVGLLWNKPSDAWLGISSLKAAGRQTAFERLLASGDIAPVQVEGIKDTLYCLAEELPLVHDAALLPRMTKRCEFIAPLDCLTWDRKLIKAIFGFEYKWEIYTPQEQRKYGYYVLPVLFGDRFAGRMEAVCDRKSRILFLKNFWPEEDFKTSSVFESTFKKSLARFAKFNGCEMV